MSGDLPQRVDELERQVKDTRQRLLDAFPGGDTEGHRHYHEMMMEADRDRKKLIAAVKEKTVAGLVWALMIGLGLACWKYLLSLIGRGP